ncbi:hypothetical protein QJ854_gp256 [Moumouvirus goulette]|uniref:Uncharacterized protein n=1 Tax=Moumouvirus goulette TaxID=1247379 RepID=M1PNF1_9VIRU|nr:hypothetical protein QJ854_gp256 [Moumouvirus goulette]AGF85526.1 hypothetical protein glt_00721 [Moumouvirus goulette]
MEVTDMINFQQEINTLINLCIDNIQYENDPVINKKIKLLNQVMCYFNRIITISENTKDYKEENSDTDTDITISDIQDDDVEYDSPTCLSDNEDYGNLFVNKIYQRQTPSTIHNINKKILGLDKIDEEILEDMFKKKMINYFTNRKIIRTKKYLKMI